MHKFLADRRVLNFVVASFSILAAVVGTAVPTASAASSRPLALVYQGPGACTHWKCHEAAAAVAYARGFDVEFVTPARLTADVFVGASLWIQPGGNAITVAQKIGKEGLALIRKFVRDGGAYVGFCAGAFLADSTVDNEETIHGLGLLPVATADYPVDSGDAGIPLILNWNGARRTFFFNGGGYFKTHGVNRTSDYTVFAWFPNGAAAAIETAYGKGGVVVTGAHPEALKEWKTDAGFEDPDGSDRYLAEDMVVRAMRITQP
jgi:glutamine amidotransferase-like uncharacterized protein